MLVVNSYELNNKCSPFVIIDFIRSVGGRATTTPTESTTAAEATATVVARLQTSHVDRSRDEWRHPTSRKHTNENVK